MKKLVLLCLFCLMEVGYVAAQSYAKVTADSIAYQLQRKKINSMLAARKLRFGQYAQSLSEHTGIFGLQTKKDIRRSNDILMDIVRTDDNIYKELKILLEYKTFQQRQIQSHSQEAESINQSFVNTIGSLKKQNADLKATLAHKQSAQNIYIVVIVLMLASILYLWSKRNRLKGLNSQP